MGIQELANELSQTRVEYSVKEAYIEIVQYTPHAVYQITPWTADPEVPVLYFTVWGPDEKPVVSVEQLANVVPVSEDLRPFISQTIHPVLGMPTLFIHPCNTRAWLENMAKDLQSEITDPTLWRLWLQSYGSGVGLALKPFEPI